MFDPKLIFSVLWLLQLMLHFIFEYSFAPFEYTTWAVMFLSLVFFNLGASTTVIFSGQEVAGSPSRHINPTSIHNFFYYFLVIYVMVAAATAIQIYETLLSLSEGELTLPLVRQIIISDFTGDRILYGMFRVFYLGVGFSIFLIAFSRHLTRKQLILVLMVGLFSAVATSGRLYLLLFFCAASALMYRNQIISGRIVFVSALSFILLFFLLAILLGKGDETGSVIDRVIWNSQVYLLGSVSCFNDFVATGVQRIDGGAMLPNPIREMLSLLGIEIQPKPALFPFAEVPVPCNTYTVLFPLFHDGSFFGVALGLFVVGIMHQFLYLKFIRSNNSVWWYLYAISIYPLVMSIFEDAYFSSPGFWTLLCVPPITYYLFSKVRAPEKAGAN